MFELFRHQSKSASNAIFYVTVGTLMMIWSILWYFYFLRGNPYAPTWQNFTCMGIILSGAAIFAIGLMFGIIGQGAKSADTTVGGVAAVPPVVPVNPNAVVPVNASVAVPANMGEPAPVMTHGVSALPENAPAAVH